MESATKLETMVKKRKRAKKLDDGDAHRWVSINHDGKTHSKRSMAMRIKKVEVPNQVKWRFKTNKSSLKFIYSWLK